MEERNREPKVIPRFLRRQVSRGRFGAEEEELVGLSLVSASHCRGAMWDNICKMGQYLLDGKIWVVT